MSKEPIRRKTKGNLVKELDAAIALLTRVRDLAVSSAASDGTSLQGQSRFLPEESPDVYSVQMPGKQWLRLSASAGPRSDAKRDRLSARRLCSNFPLTLPISCFDSQQFPNRADSIDLGDMDNHVDGAAAFLFHLFEGHASGAAHRQL